MSFYLGTDPAVGERSHAYYQEKLFLMAEGSQKKGKKEKRKKDLVQASCVRLKYIAPSQPAEVKSSPLSWVEHECHWLAQQHSPY